MRIVWLLAGFACVGVGGLGLVVPGLPGTVFFIMAAACFSRSSPRFERWVLNLPTVGPLVQRYREGEGMPRRAKRLALIMMWGAVGISLWLGPDHWLFRIALVCVALAGTWFIAVRTPTTEDVLSARS